MVQARIKNPVVIYPHVLRRFQTLEAIIEESGLASTTRNLVRLRTSQINGSSPCVHNASKQARDEGELEIRLLSLVSWRHTPYFTAAEQVALALTEMVTRLAGTDPDPVPEHFWQEVTKHYDERSVAALLLAISVTNIENRLNIATRQVAGA